jgi:hypothetical protein
MTHSIRTLILRADALPLALFGLFGISMDLLGYFAGIGAWKEVFFHNPLTIGVVEAHGLAMIMALLLLRHAAVKETTLWHGTALAVHLLLGVSNLIFWQVFIRVDAVPLGMVATVYHFVFVIANGLAILLPVGTPKLPRRYPAQADTAKF